MKRTLANQWFYIVLFVVLASSPAAAVKTFLPSVQVVSTTSPTYLDIDTDMVVTANSEQWFVLANLVLNNTTAAPFTLNIAVQESLTVVPDVSLTVSAQPGTHTYQVPVQYVGNELGLGSHTFRVLVQHDTNADVMYQTTTFLLAAVGGSGGGGGGDGPFVTGTPVEDTNLVCFDGTLGDTIKECPFWHVDSGGALTTPTGGIGIGDETPDALLDVTNVTPGVVAAIVDCAGAATTDYVCSRIEHNGTSASNNISKTAQVITVGGSFTGTNTQTIGTLYNVTGGSASTAVYVYAGDLILGSGSIANNFDINPDGHLDFESADTLSAGIFTSTADAIALQVAATGTTAQPTTALEVQNVKTGGGSGQFRTGLNVSSTGSTAGVSTAIIANATGGTEGNAALLANNGSIVTLNGSIQTFDGNLRAVQDDPNEKVLEIVCQTAGAANCASIDNAGRGGPVLRLNGDGPGGTGGTSVINTLNSTIDANGGDSAGGIDITVSEGDTVQAYRGTCNAVAGGSATDCLEITANGNTSGSNGAAFLLADGNGADAAIALTASAVDATTKTAIQTLEGDVIFGPAAFLEDFHWFQATSQFVFNDDDGTPTNADASTIEVHSDLGKASAEFIGTSDGDTTGASIIATSSGVVTTNSSGAVFTNASSSTTNDVYLAAVSALATNTNVGTGTVNVGVSAAAAGAEQNYAFDAVTGGVRSLNFQYIPTVGAPSACDVDHEANTAYDADLNTLCICSDFDGSSYEWESIKDPTVDCFT